jgi:hypothetical protein
MLNSNLKSELQKNIYIRLLKTKNGQIRPSLTEPSANTTNNTFFFENLI